MPLPPAELPMVTPAPSPLARLLASGELGARLIATARTAAAAHLGMAAPVESAQGMAAGTADSLAAPMPRRSA